jgi:hypothetical protein
MPDGMGRFCSDALAMTAAVLHGATQIADLSATPRRTDPLVEPAGTKEAYDSLAKAAA